MTIRRIANLLLSIAVGGIGWSCAPAEKRDSRGPSTSADLARRDFTPDVDQVCRAVRASYAYWHQMTSDWAAACEDARTQAGLAQDMDELMTVLETLVAELADDHVHLTVNTPSSPRLVPGQLALWPEVRDGRAWLTAVRADSWAERAGISAGAELIAIDGRSVPQAIAAYRPRFQTRPDPRADQWALRRAVAGTHNHAPQLEIVQDGGIIRTSRPREVGTDARRGERLTVGSLGDTVGYIALHDSLDALETVSAFDTALAEHPTWRALVLDLRATAGGGNTTVARGVLSRFVTREVAYQRHESPAERRAHDVERAWLELVAPRPPIFTGRLVVLVGRWTGSMGEGLAIGLQGMGRAQLVGTRMAGLRGAVDEVELPVSGWALNLPTEALFRIDGRPRHEVEPDVLVDLARASGEDPVLERGVALLGAPSPAAPASRE
ncbi:MAG: hypothetical protein B7733_04105 [Myxococcales bacterium FL481]|nr:MAG: hypothetical protein B7733_04105 [Myxococcales bacterium FL481]